MKVHNDPLPPVIVVGMHRSGTSMIARMLGRLGLFLGKDLETNHESILFINCNKWLLRQSGGSWNHPVEMANFYAQAEVMKLNEEYLGYRLSRLPVHGYLGWRRYLKGERPVPGLWAPWGWKDPRNTFTLPFWMRLFPEARVVHIYRHGVAVAASLRARAQLRLAGDVRRHRRRLRLGLYRWMPKRTQFEISTRCLDLIGGFSLWERYVNEAFANTERIGDRTLAIKYEDFLCNPVGGLRRLATFCELESDNDRIREVAADADIDNGDRFLSDPELVEFYELIRNNDWMIRLGYG